MRGYQKVPHQHLAQAGGETCILNCATNIALAAAHLHHALLSRPHGHIVVLAGAGQDLQQALQQGKEGLRPGETVHSMLHTCPWSNAG